MRALPTEPADLKMADLAEWLGRVDQPCASRQDAAERLDAALDLMGAPRHAADEPGVSPRQRAIEGLIRSTYTFLRQPTFRS